MLCYFLPHQQHAAGSIAYGTAVIEMHGPRYGFFFFKQKTAYEFSECDWSSDVCSSDLLPAVQSRHDSSDGTVKWLFATDCGQAVETVFIPEPDRGTLCISSQVGCALDCAFCATGAQGFNRNLTTAEIIGQVWLAARALGHERNGKRRITNVVLMGMGEPLLNFDAVTAALSLLRHDLGFGFAAKRVTLSTAGLVPGIDRLRETIDVALAVSLHAPE